MNEKEIINLFLKNGFQISHNTLELIKKKPDFLLSEVKKLKPRPFIITEKHIKKILEAEGKENILIEKKTKTEDKIEINSLIEFYIDPLFNPPNF